MFFFQSYRNVKIFSFVSMCFKTNALKLHLPSKCFSMSVKFDSLTRKNVTLYVFECHPLILSSRRPATRHKVYIYILYKCADCIFNSSHLSRVCDVYCTIQMRFFQYIFIFIFIDVETETFVHKIECKIVAKLFHLHRSRCLCRQFHFRP
jgi:hypothetical protein